MKCPKCGYNSFEHLDNCKKCNGSLVAFKQSVGLRPVILPAAVAIAAVAAEESSISQITSGDNTNDIFQWDISSSASALPSESTGIDDFELDLGEDFKPAVARVSDPFSFDEDLSTTSLSQPEPIKESSMTEFSFDLPDNQADDIFPQYEENPSESADQTLKQESVENIFGEFSFDLPGNQAADTLKQGDEIPAGSTVQSSDKASEGSVFGEFSFNESQEEDSPAIINTALTNQNDIQTASDFPFDAFGDLGKAESADDASNKATDEAGEFDLGSFLTMTDSLPQEKDLGKTGAAVDTQLTGSEFDALFGELEATKKTP
jgi:hypothetical protein